MNSKEANQSLSEPPLNLLFNPSLLGKQNVWEIDISNLLEVLLKLINSNGKKDLRICGIAAWTSSLIYRLKVESIFKLEKIAMEKHNQQIEEEKEIPIINPIDFPFRLLSTYPISLEDLLRVLQNMIAELSNPNRKSKNQLQLEPVEDFEFDQYFIKFEKILEEHEDYILNFLNTNEIIIFSKFVERMQPIEVARFFIALLHLAMKNEIELVQNEDSYDISVIKIWN
jgi:segregation and condensation protein A